jgi:hypothetical protein
MDVEVDNTAPTADVASAAVDYLENGSFEWTIVEIFGHRRHAGRAREEERFGSKMLRIDIPIKGDAATNGWETHYYGGASIFSYTLTDEETVVRINKPYSSASRYSLPAPRDDDGDDDDNHLELEDDSEL